METENSTTAAGRLYELLNDYRDGLAQGGTLSEVWSRVLAIDTGRVPMRLAELAAELVPAVDREVDELDDEAQATIWRNHQPEWLGPILHPNINCHDPANSVQAENLVYLSSLRNALVRAGLVEGVVPVVQVADDFIDRLEELREELKEDDSLDERVRHALLHRLSDLIEALKQVDQVGPAGIQDAVARILGHIALQQTAQKTPKSRTTLKIMACLYGIYLGVAPYTDARDSAKALTGDITAAVEAVAHELELLEAAANPPKAEPAAITDGSERLSITDGGDADEPDEPPAA